MYRGNDYAAQDNYDQCREQWELFSLKNRAYKSQVKDLKKTKIIDWVKQAVIVGVF